MSTALASRLISVDAHDDGVNSWTMARYAPAPPLAGIVHHYCDYSERTQGFTARRELPHANGVFIVNLGDPIAIIDAEARQHQINMGEGFVAGAHLLPAISRSGGAQAGIQIELPLVALQRLLGMPMHRLLNRVVSLDAVLGKAGRDLGADLLTASDAEMRIALLDRALVEALRDTPPPTLAIRHGLHALAKRPDLDIAQIAADLGWSRKHFASRVREAIGVGPRSWRRLNRFERLTRAIGPEPCWAGLAHDHGYADQAHMIREFREFAQMTPTSYLKNSLGAGGLVEA